MPGPKNSTKRPTTPRFLQHLRHGEDEVGRGRAFLQRARKPHADHFRQHHRDRLAQHRRLGLDPADAPAQHRKPVDHRRMAVGADQRVGIGDGLAALVGRPHHLRQIFEIDLVADAGAGRHDAEIVERALAPAQERIALAVALELDLDVLGERVLAAEIVDHHRMVDDEIDRRERIDALRIAAEIAPIASRIAARSTTAGTPVRSCISTRAGRNAISRSEVRS